MIKKKKNQNYFSLLKFFKHFMEGFVYKWHLWLQLEMGIDRESDSFELSELVFFSYCQIAWLHHCESNGCQPAPSDQDKTVKLIDWLIDLTLSKYKTIKQKYKRKDVIYTHPPLISSIKSVWNWMKNFTKH